MAALRSCAFTGHRPAHFSFQYDESAPGCVQNLCWKSKFCGSTITVLQISTPAAPLGSIFGPGKLFFP